MHRSNSPVAAAGLDMQGHAKSGGCPGRNELRRWHEYVSYSLNSLKGGYMEDYIGENYIV